MRPILPIIFISILTLFSCVESGKSSKKGTTKSTVKTDKKKIDHYTCPQGHKGSDKKGVCPDCSSLYVPNQAFHGKQVITFPPVVSDADKNKPSPPKNVYGDYHYICSNGHKEGGSGISENCAVCSAKLTHNQAYHR